MKHRIEDKVAFRNQDFDKKGNRINKNGGANNSTISNGANGGGG